MIGQSGLPMLTNLPPSQEQAPEDQAGKNAAGAAKDGRFAMALARSDGSGVHGPSGDGPGADKSGGEWHAPAPSATS